MGPLEIIFSWQAVLLAVLIYSTTQFVKVILDVMISTTSGKFFVRAKYGAELRKHMPWIKAIVLPALPCWIGFVLATIVPLCPDVVMEYIAQHAPHGWQGLFIRGAWGAVCGQFSGHLYDKIKDALRAFFTRESDNAG